MGIYSLISLLVFSIAPFCHEAYASVKISHETIYKMIRNDASSTLAANCRHRMKYRHSLRYRHETKALGIRNRVSIHERPKEADGSQFGDWRWA